MNKIHCESCPLQHLIKMSLQIRQLEDFLKYHINGPILDQTIVRLTAPGENYGSLMLKVDIKYKNGEKEDILHTVAKCLPPNKAMQELFNIQVTFRNEIAWYTIVIPTLLEFQKEQGVDRDADFFMKIYGARVSLDPNSDVVDHDAVILCENLVTLGYENIDRTVGFNLEESQQVVKKLAAFHALLLGLKLKEPAKFQDNVKKYVQFNDKIEKVEPVINFLREYSETSQYGSRIDGVYQNIEKESSEPWASVIHSDLWVNNIMLKKEAEKPPSVIILDLQTCGYGSVVDDLLFFLVTSVQTELVSKYFDELIQLYYTELIENLEELNVHTALFTNKSFENELKVRAPGQFAHALILIAIIMAERGKGPDFADADVIVADAIKMMFNQLSDKAKRRYAVMVHEFAERNWI